MYFSQILAAHEGEKCPSCGKKILAADSTVKVEGYRERISWSCVRCPDEDRCGFAVAA